MDGRDSQADIDTLKMSRDDLDEALACCESASMRAAKVISSQKIRAAARVTKGGK